MFNFIRRLLNLNNSNRGQVPEFFEVPYLRDEDVPAAVLMTKDTIQSICGVRIVSSYRDPQLRTVYFDFRNSKGDMFPIIQYSNRTPEEARQLAINVIAAMQDWCKGSPVRIVVYNKSYRATTH